MSDQVGSDGGAAARRKRESTREGRFFPHCGHRRCDRIVAGSIGFANFLTVSQPSRATAGSAAGNIPNSGFGKSCDESQHSKISAALEASAQ
jgi:hypothetical protein